MFNFSNYIPDFREALDRPVAASHLIISETVPN